MRSITDGKYCTAAQLPISTMYRPIPQHRYMPAHHTKLKQLNLLLGGQESETPKRGQGKG